jgi:hypothetical protein
MVKLSSPKMVVSIPRLAAYFVVCCFVMYLVEVSPQQTNNQPLRSQTTSSHQTVLITPPPAVPLQPTPTTTTSTATVTHKTTTAPAVTLPQSAQPAPVVTPAPSASVTGLAPVNPTPPPSAPSSPSDTTPPQPTTPVTSSYTSLNWAGYMATAGTYTTVSGAWTVPTATGATTSYDATWIGIGGVKSSDLIQVGTDNTVSSTGQETSEAFYEMLPQSSRTIPLQVNSGDKMTASLTQTSTNRWQITITDTTIGKTYTKTVSYASSYSSAEWIEEDPSDISNSLLSLDTFTPVSFTAAASSNSNLTLTTGNAQPVTMVTTAGKPIATPSTLGTDGQSFSVTESAAF